MNKTPGRAPSTRKSLFQKLILAVVGLAVLAAGWAWWKGRETKAEQSVYRTAKVERGDIRVTISSTGTLSAISTVTVGSQISGQVTEVLVDFNSQVKKGDVLARIDPSTYEAQIAQGTAQIAVARASLAQAQATLGNAELDYRRKASLGKDKLVAQSDVDQARAARDQAQAQVNSAQAQIRQQSASTQTTRVNLGRTVITSPVDGVVLTRSIEPGQTVAASLQAPELFTIAEDLAKMKIELAVDEADIGQVKVGQNVTFTVDAFADRQFKGVVEQVRLSATTTSNVVTFPVVVTVDNSDGTLLPGLTVNAEIAVSERNKVLKLSNAALRFKPAEGSALAQAVPGRPSGGGGSGIIDDLARAAAGMKLDARQQAAFDGAVAATKQRQEARRAQAQQGGSSMFGGGPGGPRMVTMSPANASAMQAQMRQRMAERFQQEFGVFRNTLDETQKVAWDTELGALLNVKRSTVYKLVNGKPQPVMVRLGASDGTSTEVSGGGIAEGDEVVTGEKAAG